MIYDGFAFPNISATTAQFPLVGGTYGMDVVATWGGGSVALQKRAGDNSTWLNVANAPFTANGINMFDLPPGTYRVAVTTATAVYVQLSRVPV